MTLFVFPSETRNNCVGVSFPKRRPPRIERKIDEYFFKLCPPAREINYKHQTKSEHVDFLRPLPHTEMDSVKWPGLSNTGQFL